MITRSASTAPSRIGSPRSSSAPAWEGRVAEEIKRLDEIAARGGFEARLARVEDALANRLGVDLGAEQ